MSKKVTNIYSFLLIIDTGYQSVFVSSNIKNNEVFNLIRSYKTLIYKNFRYFTYLSNFIPPSYVILTDYYVLRKVNTTKV